LQGAGTNDGREAKDDDAKASFAEVTRQHRELAKQAGQLERNWESRREKLNPNPGDFDKLPAREQVVHCLILTGERKPRARHRETKFAAIRLGCFFGR
jgi:hypothetical protein